MCYPHFANGVCNTRHNGVMGLVMKSENIMRCIKSKSILNFVTSFEWKGSRRTLMTLCMCKAIKCTRKIWKIFWLCIKPTQVIIDDLHLAWIKDTLFVNIFRLNLLLLKNKTNYGCWDRVYWYSEGEGWKWNPKKVT